MSRDMKSVILRDKCKIEQTKVLETLKREMTLVRWRDTLPDSNIMDHNVPAFCYSFVDLSRTGYRGSKIFSFLESAARITTLVFTHYEKDGSICRMNLMAFFSGFCQVRCLKAIFQNLLAQNWHSSSPLDKAHNDEWSLTHGLHETGAYFGFGSRKSQRRWKGGSMRWARNVFLQ